MTVTGLSICKHVMRDKSTNKLNRLFDYFDFSKFNNLVVGKKDCLEVCEITDISNDKIRETTTPTINNNDIDNILSETVVCIQRENYSDLPKVKITDSIYDVTCYIKDNNLLVTKHGEALGEISYWVDTKYRIPKKFKNSDNQVIFNNSPIKCYTLYESHYHQLKPKTYREYKYDNAFGDFINTHYIIH
jgi:hypothetical protein